MKSRSSRFIIYPECRVCLSRRLSCFMRGNTEKFAGAGHIPNLPVLEMPVQAAFDELPVGYMQKVGDLPTAMCRVGLIRIDVANSVGERDLSATDLDVIAVRRDENVNETLCHRNSPK